MQDIILSYHILVEERSCQFSHFPELCARLCHLARPDVGIWVRNKLRERFSWDDITFDRAWASLIAEAVTPYIEGED